MITMSLSTMMNHLQMVIPKKNRNIMKYHMRSQELLIVEKMNIEIKFVIIVTVAITTGIKTEVSTIIDQEMSKRQK